MSPSGSEAVPSRVTAPPPATLAGSAVADTSGAWFPRTVISTLASTDPPEWRTLRRNRTPKSLEPAEGAVHTGLGIDALLKVPGLDTAQS